MKNFKKQNGITLVALVVTIIVLLILAGVSLSLVAGENGILGRATKAADETIKSSAQEEASLLISDIVADYYEKKYVSDNTTDKTAVESGIKTFILTNLNPAKKTDSGYEVSASTIEDEVTVTVKDKNEKTIITGKLTDNGGIQEWIEDNAPATPSTGE